MKSTQIVAANTAMVAVTYGLARYAYGLLLPAIKKDLALDSLTLGLIASAAYTAYLLAILGSMALAAKIASRLFVLLGGASAALGMFVVACSQNSWILAVGIFIAGTSPGWVYTVMPDIVATLAQQTRHRAFLWINSGTSFGVILSGAIALWARERWRWAWFVFTIFALAVTAWNARVLPQGNSNATAHLPRLRWSWFVCAKSGPLLAFALGLGFTSSVYWTFAFDFVVTVTDWQNPATFWIIVGLAGIGGTLAGRWSRYQFSQILRWTTVGYSFSFALLSLSATGWSIFASAVLFGGSYILLTGLLALWSLRVFSQFPSAGQGANLVLLCVGQLVSPLIVGALTTEIGFREVFLGTAVLALCLVICQPSEVN